MVLHLEILVYPLTSTSRVVNCTVEMRMALICTSTSVASNVERQEDIDVFELYRPIIKSTLTLSVIIRKFFSHPSATVDNERVFNIARDVLNIRRCSLKPVRAERLILSALRYRCERRSKQPPRLPSFATFDDSDAIVDPEDHNNLDFDEVRHAAPAEREMAAAWEALFTDNDDDDDDDIAPRQD